MANRGINKVILIGNLGAEPDIRYTGDGKPVANLSVATTASWRDRDSGERQERTEWHRVVMFSRLAEIVGEYLHKGSQVYIEGRLQTRKWQDQQGTNRYTTEIVANEMQMLGGRAGTDSTPVDEARTEQKTQVPSAAKAPAKQGEGEPVTATDHDFNDDIPF